MIHFDVTKSAAAGHRSGLTRVSTRLLAELGPVATPLRWPPAGWRPEPDDWYVTAELFSEPERPGFTAFLDSHPCRLAAVFHDAIPLKLPHITWPQSVARHPAYLKLLARFDRVWAVSAGSKAELEGFWRWAGVENTPPVEVLPLGADFNAAPRAVRTAPPMAAIPQLLCVGIIEPRKNQAFLLEVCARLWAEGAEFELHLVGRTNPHFGRDIVAQAAKLARRAGGRLDLHGAATDEALARLYAVAQATLFPSIAEGCGLPLLESLWNGVPCVCSDLPVLRENAAGGGCLPVPVNDAHAWADAIRRILNHAPLLQRLTHQATTRPLPRWADTAAVLRRGLAAA